MVRRPRQRSVQGRLGENQDVARVQRGLLHVLGQLLVREVRERRRDREVRLVAPGHGAEAAGARRRRRELQAHRQELVAHLAADALVPQGPGRLARFRHGAAVERVALGALLHRQQEGRVVQAVAGAHEVRHRADEFRVRERVPERFSMRRRPTEHAAAVDAARLAVARQRARLAAVERRRPELALALVELITVRVDGVVGRLHFLRRQRALEHEEAVQVK